MTDGYGAAYLRLAEIATVATTALTTGDYVVVATSAGTTTGKVTIANLIAMVVA